MAHRPLACVMGDMDLVRPLGLAGIRCAVVARPGAAPRYSRFVDARLHWHDTWTDPGQMVDELVRFGRSQERRPVLFYEEDRELLLISRHRDQLAEAFDFVVADAELVEDVVDKARFHGLASRLGLPVPRTRVVTPGDQVTPGIEGPPFPAVVKPLTRRTDRWSPIAGNRKALRVDTLGEWQTLAERLARADVTVLVQEMIPGPESLIESYHVYVDARGTIVGEFTGRKIRTYPLEHGHSTALETTAEEDVADLGRSLVSRLGLHGVAKFDFKRRPDGSLCLLEINPRFNLWHHLGAIAGVNLPALVFNDLVGGLRDAPRCARPGVQWCKPWQDVAAARGSGMSTIAWLRWAAQCDAMRVVSLDDPLPLLGAALFEVADRAGRRLRRPSDRSHPVNSPTAAEAGQEWMDRYAS